MHNDALSFGNIHFIIIHSDLVKDNFNIFFYYYFTIHFFETFPVTLVYYLSYMRIIRGRGVGAVIGWTGSTTSGHATAMAGLDDGDGVEL